MTPEEKKLYALMAVAEEQQNAINQSIQNLNLTQEQIQTVIAKQTQATVSSAVYEGLKQGSEKMVGTAKQLNQLNQSIQKNIDQLSWKLIGLCCSGIFSIVMALVVVFMMIVPSLDEIHERRAEVKKLSEYNFQISKCDDKTCVRIIKKECGYGKNGDYCVIDLK